ncbi:MAG: hypothetical protein LBQ60_04785 [Bacteroidales bacterium]|jgi:hypothetical protein|nr:hypothetical protein [Bacteroidales bacterium]
MKHIWIILFLCSLPISCVLADMPGNRAKSEWIYPGPDEKLIYKKDTKGNRIMDFSHAGYMGGGVTLPDIPVKVTVQPLTDPKADCTELIQKAIDEVSAMPLDDKGFRGAVLLMPGVYPCDKTITISADGVVLRGSGKTENGSIISMSGQKHTAIILSNKVRQRSGNRLGNAVNGEKTVKITEKYIPAGSNSFTVAEASGFKAGDNVEIRKPVTEKWIKFMQMDDMERNGSKQTWIKPGTLLIAERRIASVNGNKITLDVPLVDSYDAEYTDDRITMVLADEVKRLKQAGVENLRIESPPQAVNHSVALYYAIRLNGEDCWLRDLDLMETMESVGLGGRRITVQRVTVVRKALHQGSSKPAEFAPNAGQVLLDRCSVEGDNIWFVALGAGQTGPIVFLNCHFKGNGRIEGHQRWSTGLLLDNCSAPDGGIDFKNRGSMGSGHGWGTAWSVAWNCEAKNYVNQIPPGTYNWVIGSKGKSTPLPRPWSGPNLPEGIFDSPGVNVLPQSLYLTQLTERLGITALKNIGYSSSDI